METFTEFADKLEPRLKFMTNFKIGKTGKTLKERYEQGYSEKYS
jgi:hypothetical protein